MLIPPVQIHRVFAWYWRPDSPVCQLFAADVAGLRSVRASDVEAAGLPIDGTLHSLAIAATTIEHDWNDGRLPRGASIMVEIDAFTGQVLRHWITVHPWCMVVAGLRRAA